MNEERVIITAAVLISALYLFSLPEIPVFIVSLIPFIATSLFSLKRKDPFWMIVMSEVLVINNQSPASSFAVQVAAAALFFTFYIASDLYVLIGSYAVSALFFILLAAFFSVWWYAAAGLVLLAAGYAALGIRWRRIRKSLEMMQ